MTFIGVIWGMVVGTWERGVNVEVESFGGPMSFSSSESRITPFRQEHYSGFGLVQAMRPLCEIRTSARWCRSPCRLLSIRSLMAMG